MESSDFDNLILERTQGVAETLNTSLALLAGKPHGGVFRSTPG